MFIAAIFSSSSRTGYCSNRLVQEIFCFLIVKLFSYVKLLSLICSLRGGYVAFRSHLNLNVWLVWDNSHSNCSWYIFPDQCTILTSSYIYKFGHVSWCKNLSGLVKSWGRCFSVNLSFFRQNAVTIFGENEIFPRNYKKEMRKIKLMLQVLNYILWTVCQGYIRALPWKLSNLSQLWTTSLRKFINFNKITDRCYTIWRKIISGFLFGFT